LPVVLVDVVMVNADPKHLLQAAAPNDQHLNAL
jgi:hypothetical protein